jgi:glycosyltransferase involved in cell wall biosynthesis
VNILYHHRTRAEDAQGIHIRSLCQAFRRLGHDVQIVGPVDVEASKVRAGSEKARGGATDLRGFRIPHWAYELLAMGYNVPAFLVLAASMALRRPALVYERYALFNVAGRLASALYRVPFVLEVNAPLSLEMAKHDGLVFRGLAQRVEDWLCRRATKTVVVTEAMARIFAERGVPMERLLVTPNGVDPDHFHPEVDGSAVRERHSLRDAFVVGFVGWVRPWHGVDTLIDAVARLKDRLGDLRLLIVGDGPALPALKEQAEKSSVTDRVIFTGPVVQDEVPAHVAAMDVAVQPNVTEYASPIKLFEYLALGKAVVAPRKPNIEEVVTDGQDALLFETGDVEDLARCLAALHDDPALRHRLSSEAIRLVRDRDYSWEGNARRVLEAVNLGGASPAPVMSTERTQ